METIEKISKLNIPIIYQLYHRD